MSIQTGDRIPSVRFKHVTSDGLQDVSSDDVFSGKKVALFGLPGAFTPVCSAQHLPGFVEKAAALRDKGFDSIACVSVNDPFVMDAWGRAHGTGENVMMLADSSGEFTRGIGLTIDLSEFGCGERSQRYSMIVDNGVVKAVNVEDSVLSCDVSSADTLLAQA